MGKSGSGKSSVINMLMGQKVADQSSGMNGCTFDSKPYTREINGVNFTFHDTAGLNEPPSGKVSSTKAIGKLYHLLRCCEDGISLLVYCLEVSRKQEGKDKMLNED